MTADELRDLRKRAVVIHHENEKPRYSLLTVPWTWGECRLCLFTWQGMIELHDDECPATA